MTEHLTKEAFIAKVFDFEKNSVWKFAGDRPTIVDFWANWCGPCKMISPLLEEIATEYEGKVNIYKVNADEENDVASAVGVQGLPSLLFIPMNEQPRLSLGALPKSAIKKLVRDVLKVE